MDLNTVNVVYSFNSDTVLECEYKINTIFEKADRVVSPISSPNFKCLLKYKVSSNKGQCCIQTHDNVEESSDLQIDEGTDIIEPIYNKRLGLSWRKQTNMQKRKSQLLQKEFINNECQNSSSCPLIDPQRLLAPLIPITHHNDQQQYYKNNYSLLKSDFRSIISKKEALLDVNKIFNIKYITTFESEKTENCVLNIAAGDNNIMKKFLCAKREKRWRHHKHRTRSYSSILNYVRLIMTFSYLLFQNCKIFHVLFVLLLTSTQYLGPIQGLLVSKSSPAIGIDLGSIDFETGSGMLVYDSTNSSTSNSSSINNRLAKNSFNLEHEVGDRVDTYLSASKNLIITSSTEGGSSGGAYLDKLDNLERSLAAVLIKVAYGTTSTTKRSIPENSYVPSLTTIATPLLTTLRYIC